MAILIPPAIIGLIFALVSTGSDGLGEGPHWDWLVIVGIYLMLGVFLDSLIYPWLLKWQPPWMGGVLAVAEFGLLIVLVNIVNDAAGGLGHVSLGESIWYFWLLWIVASLTKIVVLPILSLTYVESAAEFRRAEWSVPPPLEPLPVLASAEEAKGGPGPVIREASGVHAKPLEPLPSPSGVHRLPPQPA